jgi:hypothetical protein
VPISEIAGCHMDTVTDIWRTDGADEPDTPPAYTLVRQDVGPDSGDDTVPLWSTCRPGIDTYYVEESHQSLPTNPAALEALLALVRGETPALPHELPEPQGMLGRLRASTLTLGQQVAEFRRRIESGDLQRDDLLKLFFVR